MLVLAALCCSWMKIKIVHFTYKWNIHVFCKQAVHRHFIPRLSYVYHLECTIWQTFLTMHRSDWLGFSWNLNSQKWPTREYLKCLFMNIHLSSTTNTFHNPTSCCLPVSKKCFCIYIIWFEVPLRWPFLFWHFLETRGTLINQMLIVCVCVRAGWTDNRREHKKGHTLWEGKNTFSSM